MRWLPLGLGVGALVLVAAPVAASPRLHAWLHTPSEDPEAIAVDLEVVGETGYLLTRWQGLRVLDLAETATPRELGALDLPGFFPDDLHVEGDVLFATGWHPVGGRVLFAIDVSDPAAPAELRRVAHPAAGAVKLVGGLAYLAGPTGLAVLDVRSSAAFPEIGFLALPGARDLEVQGELAYLVTDREFLVVDVGNPQDPRVRARHALPIGRFPETAADVEMAGPKVVITLPDGFVILDVSDPDSIREQGRVEIDERPLDLEIDGDLVHVVGPHLSLLIFDATDPAAPVEIGSFYLGCDIWDVELLDGLALVTHGTTDDRLPPEPRFSDGLWIVDVSSPAGAPIELGRFAWPEPRGSADFEVRDGFGFFLTSRPGLEVFDLSNANAPAPLGWVWLPLAPRGEIELRGDVAWVVQSNPGVERSAIASLDLADLLAPRLIAFAAIDGATHDFALHGGRGYLVNEAHGLQIWDLSDPERFDLVNEIQVDLEGALPTLAVEDGILFVADREAGLRLLDLEDPEEPRELARVGGPVSAVAVRSGLAYLAGERLRILDVSNPAVPAPLGELARSGESLLLGGTRLYLGRLHDTIVDVSDPRRPVELGQQRHRLRATDGLLGFGYQGGPVVYGLFGRHAPACADGLDNDGDGLTDFREDPDCETMSTPIESTNACGLGSELPGLLLLLLGLRLCCASHGSPGRVVLRRARSGGGSRGRDLTGRRGALLSALSRR